MKKILVPVTILVAAVFSLRLVTAPASSSAVANARSAVAPGPHEPVLWGHVKSLTRSGRYFELRFDPALWLSGVTAERAALEDTGSRDVSNDYYIVDESHRLLTYLVPLNARVTVVIQGPRSTRITTSELAQIVKGKNPRQRPLFDRRNGLGFWIRVGHRYPNPVLSLDQQYQP